MAEEIAPLGRVSSALETGVNWAAILVMMGAFAAPIVAYWLGYRARQKEEAAGLAGPDLLIFKEPLHMRVIVPNVQRANGDGIVYPFEASHGSSPSS